MKNNNVLVIDSSVAIKLLYQLGEDNISQADLIIKNAQDKGTTLVMPELARYEVGNALLYKNLELPILQRLIERFYVLPIRFIPEDLITAQLTAEIAYVNKITYYDASFISLAIMLKADLVTANPKHQKKKIKGLKVISLKDYRS
ncbi:MAG: type II toxin-antitoxin system VapC family toxin [Patescibacteria group bacterium]